MPHIQPQSTLSIPAAPAALTPAPIAKPASAEVSPALWRSLTKPRPFYAAVDAMKRDRAAVEELRARYPALLEHTEPCGARAVIEALAPLLTLYGVPDRSEAEWKTFWSLYAEPLSAQPLEALRAGVADYVQDADSEFFPKPGPLLAHVKRRAAPILIACRRAERVLAEAPA